MNIFEQAKEKFANTEREELEAFAKALGVDIHHKNADDTVRQKLLEKLGAEKMIMIDGDRPPQSVTHQPVGIKDVDKLFLLNLNGKGKWQGRRQVIEIGKPDAYEGLHPHLVKWGRQACWIRYNTTVSVPLPIFNILRNAIGKRLHQVQKINEEGTRVIQNKFSPRHRFQISDHGQDKETLHLPVSQKDQFRQIAELTNGFTEYNGDEFGRGKLDLVLARMNMHPIRFRNSSDDSVRNAIMAKIGKVRGLAAA